MSMSAIWQQTFSLHLFSGDSLAGHPRSWLFFSSISSAIPGPAPLAQLALQPLWTSAGSSRYQTSEHYPFPIAETFVA